ncbi:MAG: lactonase family protein [Sporolactobacillus sp.]
MSLFKGFIGTYTKGESRGIYSFDLDEEKGALTGLRLVAELANPTYLAFSPDHQKLYSVIKEGNQGGIALFAIDKQGSLEKIGEQLDAGAPPCYLNLNPEGTVLAAANYHRGTVSIYSIGGEGAPFTLTDNVCHSGSGSDPERQEGPHVHYADYSPDGRFLVAVDLGTDQLTSYQENEGKLIEKAVFDFAPGTGPRHLIFHPKASFAYVLSELSSEIITLRFDPLNGRFTHLETRSALPDDFDGHSQGAAIKFSADGRFLYASNRGSDSIGIFRVHSESGHLSRVKHVPVAGTWPRDFEISPSGKFLIAANQNSSNLVLFACNQETGELSAPLAELAVPNPVCVKFR